MKYKTLSEIRTEIIEKYNDYLPQLDLTEGTPERDLFVEAPLEGFIYPLWEYSLYIAKLHSPHTYYTELDETDIDNYIETFQITPTSATYSTGSITFYTYNKPTQDIVIGAGTVVTTTTNPPIEFVTTSTIIMYASKEISYYNISTERWEISVGIRAQKTGPNYRAGKNTVIRINSNINGIDGCINAETVMGGTEKEDLESRLNKVIQKFQGRDIASTTGLESYIKNISPNANIAWANDPLMLRDGGLGGAIDIYVVDTNITTTSEVITISSAGLSNPINVNYTTTTVTLLKQPVDSIVSFVRNNAIVDPTKYTLTKDSGLKARSTGSSDKLTLIPTSGYQLWGFTTTVTETSPTGLSNDSTKYGFRITVDGGTQQQITVLGSAVQTIETLCTRITELIPSIECTFDSYNTAIKFLSTSTGATSSISILDGGVAGQDNNLFSSLKNANSLPEDYYLGEDVLPFTNSDKLEITYSYNSALSAIEELLYNDANHYHGRDYLVREMNEIEINLYAKFKEVDGQDFDTVKLSVESAFTALIDTNKTQNVIELADVITTINQVSGVSNLDISTISLTSLEGTKVGTDIYTGKNQYMISGNVELVRWTS